MIQSKAFSFFISSGVQFQQRLLAIAVLSAIAGSTPLTVWAADKPAQKPHLPPVASINPIIKPEDSEALTPVDPLAPVGLSAVATPTVQLNTPLVKLDNDLGVQQQDPELQAMISLQKAVHESDLQKLWEATVDKNPVIRFSLEKLAIPPDLQDKHSSRFLKKTLSALISGAVLGSTLVPGGSYYRNMGLMTGGDILRNALTGRNKPQVEALSATEQIQLAGLVDDLKTRLVQSYHDYKTTLKSLAEAQAITQKNNERYSKALKSKDALSQAALASAYYKSLAQETRLRQQAKLCRLELERIAGRDVVQELTLSLEVTPDDIAAAKSGKAHTALLDVTGQTLPNPASQKRLQQHVQQTAPNAKGVAQTPASVSAVQKAPETKQPAVAAPANQSQSKGKLKEIYDDTLMVEP